MLLTAKDYEVLKKKFPDWEIVGPVEPMISKDFKSRQGKDVMVTICNDYISVVSYSRLSKSMKTYMTLKGYHEATSAYASSGEKPAWADEKLGAISRVKQYLIIDKVIRHRTKLAEYLFTDQTLNEIFKAGQKLYKVKLSLQDENL